MLEKETIHKGPTLKFTRLKGLATHVSVPDTTANLPWSRGVRASMGQGLLSGKKGDLLNIGHNVMAYPSYPGTFEAPIALAQG